MNKDEVLTACLKEMFRRVGERYPNPKLTNQHRWYAMRAWTQQEEDDFKDWMVQYLRKKMRLNIKEAQKETSWFMLMYGWALPHNDGTLTILGKEKRL